MNAALTWDNLIPLFLAVVGCFVIGLLVGASGRISRKKPFTYRFTFIAVTGAFACSFLAFVIVAILTILKDHTWQALKETLLIGLAAAVSFLVMLVMMKKAPVPPE